MTRLTSENNFIHAPVHGQGTSVIALHGSASNSAQWRSLVSRLSDRHRVVTPDLPGYGGTSLPGSDDPQSLEELAISLRPLIDSCHEPVHLAGHSFGGAVALKIASLYPGKVRSLTLIEPAAFNTVWSSDGMSSVSTEGFLKAVRCSQIAMDKGDDYNAMRHFIDFWLGEGAWERTCPRVRQKMTGAVRQIHRDFAALAMDQFTDWDAAGVVCPVLSITGDDSPQEMRAILKTLQAKIPFMRSEIIRGAGHMLPISDPHITDPMIGEFLAQVDLGWQDISAAHFAAA